MKASNIILIGVVASFTLLITTGAFQIRFGEHEAIQEQFETQNIEINSFKYLVVKDVSFSINVESGNTPGLELRVKKGMEVPKIKYHQEGDSLIIHDLEWKDEYLGMSMSLKMPKEVEWIQASNSSLEIRESETHILNLNLNKARVTIHDKNHLNKLKIKAINESNINNFSPSLDTLEINIETSHVMINGVVNHLKGEITNNSTLSVKEINDFNFKKDESSKLHHWN